MSDRMLGRVPHREKIEGWSAISSPKIRREQRRRRKRIERQLWKREVSRIQTR